MARSRPGVRRRRRVLGAVRSAGVARAMDSIHLSKAAFITKVQVDTGCSHGAIADLPDAVIRHTESIALVLGLAIAVGALSLTHTIFRSRRWRWVRVRAWWRRTGFAVFPNSIASLFTVELGLDAPTFSRLFINANVRGRLVPLLLVAASAGARRTRGSRRRRWVRARTRVRRVVAVMADGLQLLNQEHAHGESYFASVVFLVLSVSLIECRFHGDSEVH